MRSFIPMVQGCVSRWGSGYVQGLHFFNLASALFMSFCGSWGYLTVTFSLKWRKLCQEVNIFHYLGLLVMWSEVAQSCPTLCDPVDCSLPGSSAHGIFQARILEWVAISFSRGSSPPRDQTQVSRTVGRYFTVWATREVTPKLWPESKKMIMCRGNWSTCHP